MKIARIAAATLAHTFFYHFVNLQKAGFFVSLFCKSFRKNTSFFVSLFTPTFRDNVTLARSARRCAPYIWRALRAPLVLRFSLLPSCLLSDPPILFCKFFFVSLFCKSFYLQKLPNRQLTICKSFTYKKKGMLVITAETDDR